MTERPTNQFDLARIRKEAEQILAAQVKRIREEVEQRRAAEITAAREAERSVAATGMNRLLQAVRQLDDATTLTEILEALCVALQEETTRFAVFAVLRGEPQFWRAVGFPEERSLPSDIDLSPSGIVVRAIETADTCFTQFNAFADLPAEAKASKASGRGLAVPISTAGGVSAVVYADDRGTRDIDSSAWAETVEVLVRHAGRAVGSFTASHMADFQSALVPTASTEQGSTNHTLVPAGYQVSTRFGESILTERRTARRMSASQLPWVGGARLLPGRTVSLVDLSDSGALVESELKLEPDTNVVLQLIGQSMESRITARVVRCAGHVSNGAMKYLCAVTFTEPLREVQFTSGGIEPSERPGGPWIVHPTLAASGVTPSSPVGYYR